MITANHFEKELNNILHFWSHIAYDAAHNCFYGKVSNENEVQANAPLGVVLYARILWTFSSAYLHTASPLHLERAAAAYTVLQSSFLDKEQGGYYWSVTAAGEPLDSQKKIYALAFVLYGLCAYYQATGNEVVLEQAQALFELIERKSYDETHKGYFDAFQRNWQPGENLRLSEKDEDAAKTMNTHLHVLEAYTALCRLWPNDLLQQRLRELIQLFQSVIVHPVYHHLGLYFDAQWNKQSDLISFGHDIEASWLLVEAARVTADERLIADTIKLATRIASAAAEGLHVQGGLDYEYHLPAGGRDEDKHWWVQAEGVVGFYNAWQISGNVFFLQTATKLWEFIRQHLIDHTHGEWYWGVHADMGVMQNQDKAGFWKCPYHNSRCCLEMIHRMAGKENPHVTIAFQNN